MQPVEINNISHAYLQEVIEIASHKMAIEHDWQIPDRCFEGAEALRCGAVEHNSYEGEGPPVDPMWRNLGPHGTNVSICEQPLDPTVAGRWTGIHPFCNVSIAETPVSLKQTENFQICPVKRSPAGGSVHFSAFSRKEITAYSRS